MIALHRILRWRAARSAIVAILLSSALTGGFFSTGPVGAASEETAVAFWVVNTRGISQGQLQDPTQAISRLTVFAADENGRLSPRELSAAEQVWRDAETLWIGVHGNRMSATSAVSFMRMFREAAGSPSGTMILWSWPSQVQVRGVARDSRLKAARSLAEGGLLAEWLKQLQPRGRVILVGYSFGAKIVLQAVTQSLRGEQALGDSGSNGEHSSHPAWQPKELTLVLLAAAADPGELQRAVNTAAKNCVALRIILTLNSRDPALRWYRHLWGCHGPYAIGWALPYLRQTPDSVVLTKLDLSCQVGHSHAWQKYLAAPALQSALRGIRACEDTKTLASAEPQW